MLSPLSSLTTLNIGNNKIATLPNNLPSSITTLSAVNQKTGFSLKNINGLSNLMNLKILNLNFNELTDISSLSGITTLENINLSYQSGTEITNISALANKPMLHTIDLTNNNISSLSALSNNNALKTLNINGNLITDLTPLSGLSSLERITASQNKLTSLNGLESLNNLNYLDFSDQIGVKITNVVPLSNKTKLTYLKMNGNQIADLTPFNTMTIINQLELSSNNITNLTGFAPSNTLRTLNLYGNGITSIDPLVGMTNITNLTLSYNKISDASPLATLTGLTTLQIQSNRLSTINSLATHPKIASFKSGSTFNSNFIKELNNQYTFAVPTTTLEIEKGSTQIIDISWLYNNVAYTTVSEPVSSQLNKQVSSSNGNTVLVPVWNSTDKLHKLSFTGKTVGIDTITVQMTDGYTKTFQVNVIEPGLNEIRNLQGTIDLGNVSLDLKNSTSVALPSFELEKTLNNSNWQLIMSMDEIRDQNGDIVEGLSFEYDNLLTVTTLEGQSLTHNENGCQKLNGSSITLLSGNETEQGIWTIDTNPNALKLKMGPKTDLSNGSKTFSSVITYTIVELP
jgi:Leucine-rich repeat (LRR) protein